MPLKVHLRLRFQNLGKPRTAGLCGRAAGACDCGPLSCAKIERPSPLEKPSCKVRLFAQNRFRKYRQKVTAATLFQTVSHPDFQLPSQTPHVCFHSRKRVHTRISKKDRTQRLTRRNRGLPSPGHSVALRCQRNPFYSTTLLYTYISRFSVNPHYQQQFYLRPSFIAFFNLSHKRPTFAFTSESGYTLGFRRKIAHKGTHGETGGVLGGGWYHYPRSVPHVSETLRGQGVERQTLPLFGLGRGCSRRTQKAFGTAMRLCVSLSRRRRGPAGLRDPVAIVSMIKNMINPWAGSFLIFCWANANSIKKVVLQPF